MTLKKKKYLLDTHSLFFWFFKTNISAEFIEFFDRESRKSNVYISSVSLWEVALLKKKGRIEIDDIHQWKQDLLDYSLAKLMEPTVSDMIDSTLLPDHHKDPFDRLLIAQAINNNTVLVTRDQIIPKYPVETFRI